VRCTDDLIGRSQDAYRKIRNTLRYLLGNLDGFDPRQHRVPFVEMAAIDQWAMCQLQKLIEDVTEAYENFVFHRVFSLLYTFCTVEMSSIYMDVLKDRLYCDAADSVSRRSGQTVMHAILGALVRMLAPVLAHTAEEAWEAMAHQPEDCASVHLATMPKVDASIDYAGEQAKWDKLMGLRDEVLRVLEGLRQDKTIASNQEAAVTLRCTDEDAAALRAFGAEAFAALCITSEVRIEDGAESTSVAAEKCTHEKCQRCWNYWASVGKVSNYPDLCERCADVVGSA
jgi:isoleucyl-tRNA synthetase